MRSWSPWTGGHYTSLPQKKNLHGQRSAHLPIQPWSSLVSIMFPDTHPTERKRGAGFLFWNGGSVCRSTDWDDEAHALFDCSCRNCLSVCLSVCLCSDPFRSVFIYPPYSSRQWEEGVGHSGRVVDTKPAPLAHWWQNKIRVVVEDLHSAGIGPHTHCTSFSTSHEREMGRVLFV